MRPPFLADYLNVKPSKIIYHRLYTQAICAAAAIKSLAEAAAPRQTGNRFKGEKT